MGRKYLIDTNILIYYLGDNIPADKLAVIERLLEESFSISVISEMELLGYPKLTEKEIKGIKAFLQNAEILPIDPDTVQEASAIRRRHKLKLPDAVIGATAKVHQRMLATRNEKDFNKIEGLDLFNPFD